MLRLTTLLIASILVFTGCGGQETAETETADTASAVGSAPKLEQPGYDIPMRNFAPATIGPYEVQPLFEEEIVDGHFNIRIDEGGEVNAVRVWVGPEDAEDVMVVKAEIENDYHHSHHEVPDPIPADYTLWIEIEAPDGTLHKGSTPLEEAE